MKITNLKSQITKGVSLVELILYMALFSILLLMLLQMFTTILNSQLESQATSSVAIDGRYILTRFANDVGQSNTIVTPASYGIPGSVLRVTGSSLDYSYTLSSGNLILTNNSTGTSDALNSIDTSISNLSFTKIGTISGKSTVQVSLTVTSKTTKRTGQEIKTFQTTVGTR